MKKTVLRPDYSSGNPYINIVRECIEDSGYEVISMDRLKSIRGFFDPISIVNLNWYENLSGKTAISILLSYLKKKIFVCYIKIIKRSKVVVTIHNKCNHYDNEQLSKKMLKFLVLRADKVIALCKETDRYLEELFETEYYKKNIDAKLVHMFLPNYSGSYAESDKDFFDKIRGERETGTLELLYFGRVEDYKNVPALIELASLIKERNIHITIAGDGKKEIVEKIIHDTSGRDNITFCPNYIPEDNIWGLIKKADCVVLPYKTYSVLNSGAIILAYTVGRNVICPEIGTTLDFPKDYTYTYDSQDGIKGLYERVIQVYDEYNCDHDLFEEKAKKLQELVLEQNSKELLREKIEQLYNELDGKR